MAFLDNVGTEIGKMVTPLDPYAANKAYQGIKESQQNIAASQQSVEASKVATQGVDLENQAKLLTEQERLAGVKSYRNTEQRYKEFVASGAPSAAGPSAAGPSAAGPSAAGPSAAGPSAAGPSAAGPSAAGPSAAGPSAAGAVDDSPLHLNPVFMKMYYEEYRKNSPTPQKVDAMEMEYNKNMLEIQKKNSDLKNSEQDLITKQGVAQKAADEHVEALKEIRASTVLPIVDALKNKDISTAQTLYTVTKQSLINERLKAAVAQKGSPLADEEKMNVVQQTIQEGWGELKDPHTQQFLSSLTAGTKAANEYGKAVENQANAEYKKEQIANMPAEQEKIRNENLKNRLELNTKKQLDDGKSPLSMMMVGKMTERGFDIPEGTTGAQLKTMGYDDIIKKGTKNEEKMSKDQELILKNDLKTIDEHQNNMLGQENIITKGKELQNLQKDMVTGPGGTASKLLPIQSRQQYDNIVAGITAEANVSKGQGALSDTERKNIKDSIPSYEMFANTEQFKKAIDIYLSNSRRIYAQHAKNLRLQEKRMQERGLIDGSAINEDLLKESESSPYVGAHGSKDNNQYKDVSNEEFMKKRPQ